MTALRAVLITVGCVALGSLVGSIIGGCVEWLSPAAVRALLPALLATGLTPDGRTGIALGLVAGSLTGFLLGLVTIVAEAWYKPRSQPGPDR